MTLAAPISFGKHTRPNKGLLRPQLPTQLSVYFMDDRRTVNAQAPLPKPLLSELELLQNDVTALLDVSFHFLPPGIFLTRTPLLT